MQDTLLNLIPGACSPEVHLSQYDKGRVIPFKLADGKSAYDVPAGSAIAVKATKPSGLGFVVPVSFEGDTATMTITETMSNEYGRFPAELSITNGGTLIGTANFVLNVEKSPHPEGTTDGDAETLIPELTLLVNEIRESNAKVESMTASATSLPAGSTPTAEYDSENNNLAFGIPTSEVTKADLYKAFIIKSANGSIASFSDGGDDLPMKSLKVNIVPKQSGSGDPSPSNVRPISGWDSVDITRAGKNLLNHILTTRTVNGTTFTVNADKSITISGTPTAQVRVSISSGIVTDGKVHKYFSVGTMPSGTRIYCRKVQNGATSYPTISPDANMPVGAVFDNLAIEVNTSFSGTAFTIYPMVEVGTSATAYEPYEGESKSITLPQTVYGGVLDVVSGKLTIDKGYAEFDGSSDETIYWNNALAILITRDAFKTDASTQNNVYTVNNMFADKSWAGRLSVDGTVGLHFGQPWIFLKYSQITDEATARTFLTSHPLQVAYKLQTPTEIQLTPTEVKSLLGSNNIWSESGTVEVEYRADSTLAYNELVAMILENIGG